MLERKMKSVALGKVTWDKHKGRAGLHQLDTKRGFQLRMVSIGLAHETLS